MANFAERSGSLKPLIDPPSTMMTSLSDVEATAIEKALAGALPVARPARSVEYGLFFQCLALRDNPGSAPEAFRELLQTLESVPALELFDHAEQRGLAPRMQISRLFLLEWLVGRAQRVGEATAVADLRQYLAVEEIEVTEALLLDGIHVGAPVRIAEFDLVPWGTLPQTDSKWQVSVRSLCGHVPDSALVRTHRLPRLHLRPWDQPPAFVPRTIDDMMDALRCTTAVAAAGWRPRALSVEAPEWAPWKPEINQFGVDGSSMPMSTEFDLQLQQRVTACITQFRRLPPDLQIRWRIALDRLNRSVCAGINGVNAAVELGIALEAAFGPIGENAKIARTLKRRVQQLLGGSAREKSAAGDMAVRVYDLRSRAVHSGRFDADARGVAEWSDPSRVLEKIRGGQRLVASCLERMIVNGEPAWTPG